MLREFTLAKHCLWRDGRALNRALAATARLLLFYSLLFAAGLATGPGR